MDQTIEIRGLSCEGCETTVEEPLDSVDGVMGVQDDRNTDLATVEGEPKRDKLEQAVIDSGYEVARS